VLTFWVHRSVAKFLIGFSNFKNGFQSRGPAFDTRFESTRDLLALVEHYAILLLMMINLVYTFIALSFVSVLISGYSENDTHTFIPFERGFVGNRSEAPAMAARTNQGYEDFMKMKTNVGHNRLQDCPGMVGPLDDGKYYCTGKLHGYCDRRSGTCFCNQGYDGSSCNICDPMHRLIGDLCYEQSFCPNGPCNCDDFRDGDDCKEFTCSKFHEYCTRCDQAGCLECFEGYGVNKNKELGQQCESCQKFDPRCHSCDETACLGCTDLLLNSIRRSGRRPHDPILPQEDLERQLSRSIPFGSHESEAFDDAEYYKLVAPHLVPLDAYAVSCDQGTNDDASFECKRVTISNKICGHEGVISFVSPEYQVREDEGHIRLTLKRSGGGAGAANVSYSIEEDITGTDGFLRDVSPTAMYTISQTIVFDNHEGEY
jgi:hypothetical protein